MVNDASDDNAKQLFTELEQEFESLTLINHEQNQGKGGAVRTGIETANNLGFEYAIQVDADAQHCLEDVKRLIELSKANPNKLISGKPVYDESVPKHRLIARYITHFWVHVETLSLQLKDSMCGFRVYPVQASFALFSQDIIGKRMDFDTDIMVRLYWQGTETVFLDTKVIYPKDGVSHFQPFNDNLLISWMHTRLFFGMLVRSPKLMLRNVKRWLGD